MKSKIFIGPLNTANQSKALAEALRGQGIKADYVTWSTSEKYNVFGYSCEKLMFLFEKPRIRGLNRLLGYFHFLKAVIKYNTFVFISPQTILTNNSDLPVLRFLRKKIIIIFTGCAERDPFFDSSNPDYCCNVCKDKNWQKMFLCDNLNEKIRRVWKLEQYADFIISQDDSAAFLKEKKAIWFYVICEIANQLEHIKDFNCEKIKIVYLPGNKLLKQNHIILPVIEKISTEHSVEIVIKNEVWPREKILEELSSAHILVDQLGVGYGVLAVEAMARGCVVLEGYQAWFQNKVPDIPVYKTSSKTLYEDICFLINNRNILKEYSHRSLQFYQQHHTPDEAGKFYKKILNLR